MDTFTEEIIDWKTSFFCVVVFIVEYVKVIALKVKKERHFNLKVTVYFSAIFFK